MNQHEPEKFAGKCVSLRYLIKKSLIVVPDTEIGIVKMKCSRLLLLVLFLLLFFSCNEKVETIRPVSSKIDGPLGDYFEVVQRDYKIVGNQVNFEFKRIDDGMMESPMVAELLDDSGNLIGTSTVDSNSNHDDLRFLYANKTGESSAIAFSMIGLNPARVRFSSSSPASTKALEEEKEVSTVLEEDVAVEDTLVIEAEDVVVEEEIDDVAEVEEEEEEEEIISTSPTSPINSDSSGSKQWDKVLDDFEKYVDQYISLLKKSKSGDLSAMTEYVSFLEKAEKLEKDLDRAEDELSASQLQRYLKITQKMTNAALEIL